MRLIILALLATPFVLAGLPVLFYRFLIWLGCEAVVAEPLAVFAGAGWLVLWIAVIGGAIQIASEERYQYDEEEDDAERAP